MDKLKVLQIGVPKCGNFWLYQIIQQVLKRSGFNHSSFIEKQPIYELAKNWVLNYPDQARIDVLEIHDIQHSYRISSIFQMPIEDLTAYVSGTSHVWTHSPVCKRSEEVFQLFDKKVCIIRDPRDRAISASKYYCGEYMMKHFPQEETDPKKFLDKNFDDLMQEWVWHVYGHLRLSESNDIHICFFEGFLNNFQDELNKLLTYLELDLSQKQKDEITEAMHFSNLKKKNPRHLRKGESGYWQDYLSEEQINRAEVIAGPLMNFLHYSLSPGEENVPNNEFPHRNFDLLKQEIIASVKSENS